MMTCKPEKYFLIVTALTKANVDLLVMKTLFFFVCAQTQFRWYSLTHSLRGTTALTGASRR
jgi:hypothetical protein